MEKLVKKILEHIGEDPNREGLYETPLRVMKSWKTIFSGYNQDPLDVIKTFASDGYDQIVLLRDIEMYSMCEHHMLPFVGRAHVAYIPGERVIGISKLARLVDIFSKRLQIQERIGEQVTNILMTELKAQGAACIIDEGSRKTAFYDGYIIDEGGFPHQSFQQIGIDEFDQVMKIIKAALKAIRSIFGFHTFQCGNNYKGPVPNYSDKYQR